jgi:hypothetical protein
MHVLVMFTPGGLAQLFREIPGADVTEIAALAARYGTRLIGPPLDDTVYSINTPRR